MSCKTLQEGKPGLYKNNVLEVNSDYLRIYDTLTWDNTHDVDFEVAFTINEGSTNLSIASFGRYNNASTGFVEVGYRNGNVTVGFYSPQRTPAIVSVIVPINYSLNDHTITVNNGEAFYNGVFISLFNNRVISVDTDTSVFGRVLLGGAYLDGSIKNFSINGKYFALNEVRGVEFYSEDKTIVGERITSHSGGLEYIEETMIQRYGVERGERKNKLVSGNGDKLTLSETTSVGDTFKITFTLDETPVSNNYIFTDTALTQSQFISFTTGVINSVGTSIVFLYIDGVLVGGATDLRNHIGSVITLETTLSVGANIEFVGGESSSSSNISLYDFSINDQVYNLNEHNGDKFYSEDGSTTGTRITSNSGGRNYISLEMIKKI